MKIERRAGRQCEWATEREEKEEKLWENLPCDELCRAINLVQHISIWMSIPCVCVQVWQKMLINDA